MAVFNLGSINVDHFYELPHLPKPGETLTAIAYRTGLGGKGANQSVAAARAGSRVVHIGAIGPDAAWTIDRLSAAGVDTTHIATGDASTGHAIINVDQAGENAIVIHPGANRAQDLNRIENALSVAKRGDLFLLQNETSLQFEAAELAADRGLTVVYSAAPFQAGAARPIMPFAEVLVVNEVEAAQLAENLGTSPQDIPVRSLLVTKGAQGAVWFDRAATNPVSVPAFPVDPVDTTGAGDCFIGFVVAGLDQGMGVRDAMRFGAAAAAIKVTRKGTADAIPARADVDAFLARLETK